MAHSASTASPQQRARRLGIALVSVALATVIRWAIGGYVMQGIPFITYFPAVVLATLLGVPKSPGFLSNAEEHFMHNTTLLIILIVLLLLVNGGWYGRGRWY